MKSVGKESVWSSSHDKKIIVWEVNGDNISKQCELNAHSSKINGLVVTSGHVWSCSNDKNLFVWEKDSKMLVKEIANAHNDSILCAAHLDDLVFTGSASLCKTLRSWSLSFSSQSLSNGSTSFPLTTSVASNENLVNQNKNITAF